LPEEVPSKHEVDRPRIERAVREILFTIGEGSERKGILGTSERVADACACLFAGLGEDPAHHLEVGFMEAALAATEVTAQRCPFPE
jgi:GTP cyclohydrolase IA